MSDEKSKTDSFQKILDKLSPKIRSMLFGYIEKMVGEYITKFIQRITRKIMIMISGLIISSIGTIFVLVGFVKLLNEILNSYWMGWTIGGLIALCVGLLLYSTTRR